MVELSCQELVELVTDYLDGALPDDERRRFEAHLDDCGNCRAYLEQMRRTIQIAGTLTPETVPPHAGEALLAAFRDWKATTPS